MQRRCNWWELQLGEQLQPPFLWWQRIFVVFSHGYLVWLLCSWPTTSWYRETIRSSWTSNTTYSSHAEISKNTGFRRRERYASQPPQSPMRQLRRQTSLWSGLLSERTKQKICVIFFIIIIIRWYATQWHITYCICTNLYLFIFPW